MFVVYSDETENEVYALFYRDVLLVSFVWMIMKNISCASGSEPFLFSLSNSLEMAEYFFEDRAAK